MSYQSLIKICWWYWDLCDLTTLKPGCWIGHANVQSCVLIYFQYKPISLQYSWMSVEQPIGIDCVLYMHHWEFPANMKKIPMLTYPIDEEIVILFENSGWNRFKLNILYFSFSDCGELRSDSRAYDIARSMVNAGRCDMYVQLQNNSIGLHEKFETVLWEKGVLFIYIDSNEVAKYNEAPFYLAVLYCSLVHRTLWKLLYYDLHILAKSLAGYKSFCDEW